MKRWPIIRHVRYLVWRWRVNRHYALWYSLGFYPVHAEQDYAELDRIWRGER